MNSLDNFYTVREAAKKCGISYMALHQRIYRGTVPVTRKGKRVVLISKDDIPKIMEDKNRRSNLPWNSDDPTRDSGHPLYKCYYNMVRRCYSEKYRSFDKYGGSGIKVCDRWLNSFSDFVSDMGEPPTQYHSIDRHPNPQGNYEPGNCRWANPEEKRLEKSKSGSSSQCC